jgi:hypothetical protein
VKFTFAVPRGPFKRARQTVFVWVQASLGGRSRTATTRIVIAPPAG